MRLDCLVCKGSGFIESISRDNCSGMPMIGMTKCPECSKRAEPASDPVDSPAHYNLGKIEVIDVIEAAELNFSLGNVVKYVARAGSKDPAKTVEDLRKAAWYLDREIKRLTK